MVQKEALWMLIASQKAHHRPKSLGLGLVKGCFYHRNNSNPFRTIRSLVPLMFCTLIRWPKVIKEITSASPWTSKERLQFLSKWNFQVSFLFNAHEMATTIWVEGASSPHYFFLLASSNPISSYRLRPLRPSSYSSCPVKSHWYLWYLNCSQLSRTHVHL